MPRTLPFSDNADPGTTPKFLVEFDFATPVRLSSFGQYTYGGDIYGAAGVTWNPRNRSLIVMDHLFNYAAAFRTRAEGDALNIWQTYVGTPSVDGDFEQIVAGEVGQVGLNPPQIAVTYHHITPTVYPFTIASPATGMNHIPKDGTIIRTENGEVILTRRV